MTNEIFNNEILKTVSFNKMKKYATEIMRDVNDNNSFTDKMCKVIIGLLTPYAGNVEVSGRFYAKGDALKEYIRKAKSALGAWKYNCIICIDNNKDYVIDNTIPGFMTLSEVHE